MSIQTIYARLVQAGMSPESACGMMGNMDAESGMRSNNAQDGLSPLSDPVYTDYANRGLIDFANDRIGYGLCQWTLPSRKRKMLDFHRQRGVSIDHEDTQVDFCLWELQNEPEFRQLWNFLRTNKGVAAAADLICEKFERPAVNNYGPRQEAANGFYMTLGGMTVPEQGTIAGGASPSPTVEVEKYWPPRVLAYGMTGPDVVALQGLLIAHGYAAGISGTFDTTADAQLRAFQRAEGLTVDGIAGPKSWAALVKGV